MTEPDWLSTDSPKIMLRHVRSRLSARKLQLVACGCCRLFEELFSDDQRRALEVVERYTDGLADFQEYQSAVDQFGRDSVNCHTVAMPTAAGHDGPSIPKIALADALMAVVTTPADFGIERVIDYGPTVARGVFTTHFHPATQSVKRRMCEVFREIVGNPFRERVAAGPEWSAAGGKAATWMLKVNQTARAIALGVQADQAFDRLPILADALEDDGCDDAELLSHLRHHSHHLRGCWAVDLVLGKS